MIQKIKTCTVCHEQKPIDDFYLEKRGPYKIRRSDCKICKNAKKQEWARNHRAHINLYKKTHRKGENSWRRSRYLSDGDWRKRRLLENKAWRCGVKRTEVEQLQEKWDGSCAICGITSVANPSKNWHIDHCHDTHKLRNILCHHCNTMIGLAKENPSILRKAAEYLEKHQEAQS